MCAPSRVWALNGGRTGAAREGKQTASNQNHRRQFARKFLGHEIENPPNGHSHCLWPVRGHGNVGDICFGRAASWLHFGIRRIVRLGVDIWLPARRLAIWPHRSDLGVGCRAPLVAKGILTPALWVDFSKSGLKGLCSRGAETAGRQDREVRLPRVCRSTGSRASRLRRSAAQPPTAHAPLPEDRQSWPECPPGDALQPGALRRRCSYHLRRQGLAGREFLRA